MDLLTPQAYQARFGNSDDALPTKLPRLGAMTLRVEDLGRTQAILAESKIAFDRQKSATIRVGPAFTGGLTLEFTEEPVD